MTAETLILAALGYAVLCAWLHVCVLKARRRHRCRGGADKIVLSVKPLA